MTDLKTYLDKFTETDWLAAVDELLPSIHEVDQNAVRIWFRFYPLNFSRFVAAAEDREELIRTLALQGDFELANQIDTSHHFLYGHRYWKELKAAVEAVLELPASAGGESDGGAKAVSGLVSIINDVSKRAAEKLKVDTSLVTAIAAVGLMTLNQVGLDAFKAAKGVSAKASRLMSKSPEEIVEARKTDDSQGLFGFLKTVNKKFSVLYTATEYTGKFPVLNEQEITLASANDTSKNWKELDERCWEGPVPVECTAASCGTCWVGVLGGQEKLTEVGRRERRQMKVFGYNQPEDEKPYMRLACQSRAKGNVTLVIPPWNGVFGKKIYGNVEEVDLEPATTSAKKLRETVATAVTGE